MVSVGMAHDVKMWSSENLAISNLLEYAKCCLFPQLDVYDDMNINSYHRKTKWRSKCFGKGRTKPIYDGWSQLILSLSTEGNLYLTLKR